MRSAGAGDAAGTLAGNVPAAAAVLLQSFLNCIPRNGNFAVAQIMDHRSRIMDQIDKDAAAKQQPKPDRSEIMRRFPSSVIR